ncbi:Insect cuticle protein,Chitin-binding type R&R consensus [Cinara cedri]|uniref:Insect cuticle protein,Chitin-binding type R&R consensus n=1 Tax=Cinara cedri TaxID=506608 RepID=A0A5E4MX21_9HEMI|nr:Insect cuticle protein,Chitin-binding type R&R consensus [Cinara cedri]
MNSKTLYVFVAVSVVSVSMIAAVPSYEHYAAEQSNADGGHYESHAPKSYHFEYAVNDPTTGDIKNQNEVSDGHGSVKGTYSLVEPDGSTRVVEYTADDVHGFQAEVKKIESQYKPSSSEHKFEHKAPSYPAPVKYTFAAPVVEEQHYDHENYYSH